MNKGIILLFFLIQMAINLKGNSIYPILSDASSMGIGNAVTGAKFSQDAGMINPARLNQFSNGRLLFSSEGGFSNSITREIIAYRFNSYPLNIIFVHEGVFDIPDTRNALLDFNGDGELNGDDRLDVKHITAFSQHRFVVMIHQSMKWKQWNIGFGMNSIITSLLDETGYGMSIKSGIFRSWGSSFSLGLEIKNIEIIPINWSSDISYHLYPEIFLGGSITPVFQEEWYEVNLFMDGGLKFKTRTLDDDFNILEHGGMYRYGVEVNIQNACALRFGRSGRNKFAFGFSIASGKTSINYSMNSIGGVSQINQHIISFNFDVKRLKKWFQ
jgi:hypothetical protein